MLKSLFPFLYFAILGGVAFVVFKYLKLAMLPATIVRVLETIGGGPGHEEALVLLIGIALGLLTASILLAVLKAIGIDTGL